MKSKWATQQKGFTIVELLIVIVVIGILAAITVVAYNGMQNRALVSRSINDLSSINKAILLHKAANDSYPVSISWRSSNDYPNDYVPGLVPNFIPKLPTPVFSGGAGLTESYMYVSDGNSYKIIAHTGRYSDLCPLAKAQDSRLVSNRDCWAYGYYDAVGYGY